MKTSVMFAVATMGMLGAMSDASAGGNFGFGYSASTITTSQTYAAPVYSAPAPVAYGAQPYCREYNGQVIVGGRYQQSYGTACMQPDGAWQISTPNGMGTPVGYIAPPPYAAYSAPTYYAPAPIYSAPAYPYTRSSFNIFYSDNDWNRGRGWGHGYRDNWRGHKVYRDDWRGRGGWDNGHGRHGHGGWR